MLWRENLAIHDFAGTTINREINAAESPRIRITCRDSNTIDVVRDTLMYMTANDMIDEAAQTQTVNEIPAEDDLLSATETLNPAAEETQSDLVDTFASAPDSSAMLTDANESQASIELVFTFSGDCWMNLTDATGEAIAYGVKASGRVMPVSGIPPFEVTLGAPEVVQISYNGEPVDMSGFQAGRTARFSLPLGGE